MDMIDANRFVYTYEPAWHGKGNKINPGTRVLDGAVQCGLDYNVIKRPLYYYDAEDTNNYVRMKNQNALLRSTDWNQFGVVSDNKYTILQNMDAFAKLDVLLDTGLVELDCMGALKGGEIAWALLRPIKDASMEVQEGDPVTYNILYSNHHDGATANRLGFTPVRVVCWNTLSFAISNEQSKLLRLRHTSDILNTTEAAIEAMDLLKSSFITSVENYRKLTAVKVVDKEKYVRLVLGLTGKDSTRANNIVGKVLSFSRGDSAWDMYNAVTEYTTHHAGSDGDKRLTSLWFGTNAKLNQNALDITMQAAA